jgi:hypothetical protein
MTFSVNDEQPIQLNFLDHTEVTTVHNCNQENHKMIVKMQQSDDSKMYFLQYTKEKQDNKFTEFCSNPSLLLLYTG